MHKLIFFFMLGLPLAAQTVTIPPSTVIYATCTSNPQQLTTTATKNGKVFILFPTVTCKIDLSNQSFNFKCVDNADGT